MTGHETDHDEVLLRELNEQLRKNPNNVQLLVEKGYLLMEPFHDAEESLALFKRAVELAPNNVDALFWLAKSLYHDHYNEQEPKVILERALQIDPRRADCHDFLAGVLHALNYDLKLTIVHLKKTIALEPAWIGPRIRLCYALLKNGDIDEAIAEANIAFEIFKTTKCPVPTTPMEEYYEQVITGRTSYTHRDFDELFIDIETAKKTRSKQ